MGRYIPKKRSIPMKKLVIYAAAALLSAGCNLEKPNVEKAKVVVENCLRAIDEGDVKKVRDEYYTSEFVKAETEQELSHKFNKLKEIAGPITSIELKESTLETEMGEEACVHLVYLVKHTRVTTKEDFVVVIEGGKHKIGSHLVTNE
jgi:hypothetical protein